MNSIRPHCTKTTFLSFFLLFSPTLSFFLSRSSLFSSVLILCKPCLSSSSLSFPFIIEQMQKRFLVFGGPLSHPRGGADKKEETEANTHMRLDIYYWSNTAAPSSRPLEPAAYITCRRYMILRAVLNALWPFPPNTPPSAHPHFLPFPLISLATLFPFKVVGVQYVAGGCR